MKKTELTKVVALEMVLDYIKDNQDLTDKIQAMLEQEKKASTRKRKTESKTAKEKAENMKKVVNAFKENNIDDLLTLSEIGDLIGLTEASPQKLNAIMTPLVNNGTFTKDKKDKKVAYKLA